MAIARTLMATDTRGAEYYIFGVALHSSIVGHRNLHGPYTKERKRSAAPSMRTLTILYFCIHEAR